MDVSLKDLRELLSADGSRIVPMPSPDHPYKIGANYFIRSALYHYTGKLVAVYSQELVLEGAAWIADDGRFADAVAEGKFNEVEPYPDGKQVIVGRQSIQDCVEVSFPVPRSQK